MSKKLCLLLIGVLLLNLCACSSESANIDESIELSYAKMNAEEDISSLSLEEAYQYAVEQNKSNPTVHRNIGELQSETEEIIEMDDQYYQSYVGNGDIRYVYLNKSEFPQSLDKAEWFFFTAGIDDVYSVKLLGRIDEGRK